MRRSDETRDIKEVVTKFAQAKALLDEARERYEKARSEVLSMFEVGKYKVEDWELSIFIREVIPYKEVVNVAVELLRDAIGREDWSTVQLALERLTNPPRENAKVITIRKV